MHRTGLIALAVFTLILAIGAGGIVLRPGSPRHGHAPPSEPPKRLPRSLKDEIPPLIPKEPAEALTTFRALDGFRMELVAHEPNVASPVAAAYDEDGRLYVIEMRDYPNPL